MKILITGGNSAIALKIAKVLSSHQLILADYGEMPNYQSLNLKMISLGTENKNTTAHCLLKTCLDETAEVLLPLRLFETEVLAGAETLFNEFSISVMLPTLQRLGDFLPSRKSHNFLLKNNNALLFSSLNNADTTVNGAFFVDEQGLSLITI